MSGLMALPISTICQRTFFGFRLALLSALLLLALMPVAFGQCKDCTIPLPADVLGAHDDGGRGCLGCHAPHNDASELKSRVETGLWGGGVFPEYGQLLKLEQGDHSIEISPNGLATEGSEVSGILLCISCHDGNITPQNMAATRSYEQRIGALSEAGRMPVRSFLGDDVFGTHLIDHPLGVSATIATGYGLEFADGKFSVKPDTPYARFVANYGWPTLSPRNRSNPYGLDKEGRPYLICTTCHNQHAMSVYTSQSTSPIAGDEGGQYYATYFFVNGPYNPSINIVSDRNTSSNMQFCRQCHFNLANEGNNTDVVRTIFR